MLLHRDIEYGVRTAIEKAQSAGDLPVFDIPEIRIERPRDLTHGDYATASALQMARLARMAPIKIAHLIADNFVVPDYISDIDVAPPGFINFRLATKYVQGIVDEILHDGVDFGRINIGNNKKAQIEFVSANPTGPITIGRTRGGVIGDTLARLMEAGGYDVTREYYYNDAGRQIQMLGESVQIRYQQLLGKEVDLTDDHYQGQYIVDIAQSLVAEHGDALLDESADYFSDYAKARISKQQKASLDRINIHHDVYYNENDLYSSGRLQEALDVLQENGYVYETDDGAKWLRTTAFGDDKDRVIIRSGDGLPTYRLPDIAYHWHKAQRGFDVVIDVFGPDHHAVAPQVLMGVQMLGFDTDFVHTLVHQIVNLERDGTQLRMSTRRGDYVTLDELVDEVGSDPVRYFMLARSANSGVLFDLTLAIEHSDKNPVYYIQNAHVRCAGIFRKWAEAGFDADADDGADLSLLTHERELAFLRKSAELSAVIEQCITTFEPHHIAFFAYELATTFHTAYEECRVLHSDVPHDLALARLRFYRAAKTVLARVLNLMGMSAPEVM
ncbi:MAG: arginine--tRNA ligase [Anaerolineae bacterium]|nr:arginine--tRNA ligase [Anaerolineae bacterium]MCO5203579.1 arginine--tRNA ligase [Anaerolineae bacterium]